METFRFRFDAKRLRAVPKRYLGFLIASGHCCNELAVLLPYAIFEHDLKGANDVECAFIMTRKLTLDRVLISKIVEYGELCDKFFRDAPKDDDVVRELAAEYEPISAQLRAAKWARILRNKISFHYDPKHALSALSELSDDHPLELTAGTFKGVTLFDFAEEVVGRPIFALAGGGDIGKGMDVADRFTVALVSAITFFHARATIALFKSFNMVSERFRSKIRDRYCAAPGKVRVPITISAGYAASVRRKQKWR